MVLRSANVEAMRKAGTVALLGARPETIRQRMAEDKKTLELRPPLKGADPLAEVDEVLAARREAYETAADLKIETDGLRIDEVARRITKSQAPRGI